MSAPIIILVASGLLQYMLLGVSQVSPATMVHSAEAFVPPTKTTCVDERALRLGNNRQSFIARSCREKRNADCGERNEKDEIEGKEPTCIDLGSNLSNTAATMTTDGWKKGETIQVFAKRSATLILAASMAVTAPMPVMAELEPAIILSNPPKTHTTLCLSSVFHESSLILAAASPYTGQLVDTSNAIVVRLDSGVTYNDLREGTGEGVATEGKRVNIQWVLKRSNGYSIDSSAQNDGVPFIFVVGNSKQGKENRAISGLDEGIRGMRVGGIRRIVIPPSLSYVEGLGEDSPGPVPPGFGPKQRIKRVMENRMDVPDESFLLDVKLTRVQ